MRWITAAVVAGVGILIVALLSVLAVALLAERSNDDLRRDLAETVEPFALNLDRLRVAVHRTAAEARAYALTVDSATRARYEGARGELALVEEELLTAAAGTPYEVAARDTAALAAEHTSIADEIVEHVDDGDLLTAMRLVIDDAPPRLQEFEFATAALRNEVAREANRLREDIRDSNDRQQVVLMSAAGVGVAAVVALALLTAGVVRASETSRAERARFEAASAALGRGLCQLDARGRITHLNPAGEALLGYASGDVRGRDEHAMLHTSRLDGSPLPEEECRVVGSLKDGSAYSGTEAFSRNDGSLLPVDLSTAPIIVDGRTIGAVVAFDEATDRLGDERRTDDFLAFASHGLRDPLTTVHGYARFLRNRLHDDPTEFSADAREAIEALDAETGRMDDMVEALLDLARIDSRRLIMDPAEVDLREVVSEAVERLLIRHPSAVISLDAPSVAVQAYTDETRVRQMLSSLLDNAAKYGGRPPHIDLRLAVENDTVRISVRDDGRGIAPEDQPHIFERFYRSGDPQAAGLGLGLFVTKQIALALGGDVSFTSDVDGTEFRLTLPVRAPATRR